MSCVSTQHRQFCKVLRACTAVLPQGRYTINTNSKNNHPYVVTSTTAKPGDRDVTLRRWVNNSRRLEDWCLPSLSRPCSTRKVLFSV
jgi:hypothetical protein